MDVTTVGDSFEGEVCFEVDDLAFMIAYEVVEGYGGPLRVEEWWLLEAWRGDAPVKLTPTLVGGAVFLWDDRIKAAILADYRKTQAAL